MPNKLDAQKRYGVVGETKSFLNLNLRMIVMKSRTRILTGICLLVVAGVWFFWPSARQHAVKSQDRNGGATAAVTQKSTGPGAAGSTTKVVTLSTNKLAYRLSNTTNSIKVLQSNPHAILFSNDLTNTEKP